MEAGSLHEGGDVFRALTDNGRWSRSQRGRLSGRRAGPADGYRHWRVCLVVLLGSVVTCVREPEHAYARILSVNLMSDEILLVLPIDSCGTFPTRRHCSIVDRSQ
jgi:hypothetical protein